MTTLCKDGMEQEKGNALSYPNRANWVINYKSECSDYIILIISKLSRFDIVTKIKSIHFSSITSFVNI